MGQPNFGGEFKHDAVAQIAERGYPVAAVSQHLGVSQHSLYAWKRPLARQVSSDSGKDAETRQLKRELARVTEERDILSEPHRPPDQTDGYQGANWLQAPAGQLWWQTVPGGRQHAGSPARRGCARPCLGDRHHLHSHP